MKRRGAYEAKALGVTPEGTTPGQRSLTEGFRSASRGCAQDQLEGGDVWSGGGLERVALRPGFGAEPQQRQQGAQRLPAGGRVTPPANSQGDKERGRKGSKADAAELASPRASGGAIEVDACIPRLVACRVDALTIAYQVDVPSAVRDEFDERQAIGANARDVELRLGPFRFSLARARAKDRFVFENHDCYVLHDREATGGWNIEVVLRAVFLATHTLERCIALSDEIARAVGDVRASRLRRFDLAADYVGFPLRRADAERLATKRAKVKGFLTEAKDLDEIEHGREMLEHLSASCEVTGITVAPGNDVMARIYDKTAELAIPGKEEKRAIEEELWTRSGWQPGERVTRVEFQLRGEMLASLKLRNPEDLSSRVDSVWQYCVTRWLRMVVPTRTRRWRCPLDERWRVVVATVFYHPDEPATRRRVRGGATAEQALGTAMSRLGAIGKLPRTPGVDEQALVDAMSPGEQELWLRAMVECIFAAQAGDAYEQLIMKHGGREGALRMIVRLKEKRARFWSADDLTDGFIDGPELDGPTSELRDAWLHPTAQEAALS